MHAERQGQRTSREQLGSNKGALAAIFARLSRQRKSKTRLSLLVLPLLIYRSSTAIVRTTSGTLSNDPRDPPRHRFILSRLLPLPPTPHHPSLLPFLVPPVPPHPPHPRRLRPTLPRSRVRTLPRRIGTVGGSRARSTRRGTRCGQGRLRRSEAEQGA